MNRGHFLRSAAVCAFMLIVMIFPTVSSSVEITDKVIAIVNDDVITMSELIAEGGSDLTGDSASVLINGMTVKEARDNVLEQIIMKKLLDQAVKEYGLDITEIDVDRAILEQLKMNGLSKQDLNEILAKEGKTYVEYRKQVEYTIKKDRLIARKLSTHIIVTDEEVNAYFKEHIADYKDRKEFRISEIVFGIPQGATESMVLETRIKADMVLKKLKAGAPFEDMAKEYSMASDAEKGGDMGFIQPNTLDPGFVALLNKMKIGETSEVIGTESGFIIFRITDTRPLTNITANDVKPEITAIIRQEKTISYFERWMKEIREAAFVQKLI